MYNHFQYAKYDSDEYKYNEYLTNHLKKQNKGSQSQDSERQKTYRSEWSFQSKVNNPKFSSIEDAQKFAKKLYRSRTWVKLWTKSLETDYSRLFGSSSQPKLAAMNSKIMGKSLSGCTDGNTVTLCVINGLDKYTLLHELAHCLGNMHHGRSFRQCLLSLVGTFMGAQEKKILKEEFKKNKLAFGEPKKPQTFDVWIASKERMKTMRTKL